MVYVILRQDQLDENNGKKHLMRHSVSLANIWRDWKLSVTNYQIGGVGPSNQDQKKEKQQIIWLNIIAFLEMKCQVLKVNKTLWKKKIYKEGLLSL